VGQYTSGDAHGAGDQLRRICPIVFLFTLPSFPTRGNARGNKDAKASPRHLMGPWGFVLLAYGIVWGAILFYSISLRRRYRRAEEELARLRELEAAQTHAQK
jgi:CcmD family protein